MKVAKELLVETSESPHVLAATPRSLSKSLNNLSVPSIVTHLCDDENGATVPSRRRQVASCAYPYHPLSQIDDGEG